MCDAQIYWGLDFVRRTVFQKSKLSMFSFFPLSSFLSVLAFSLKSD
jgi:hypothetical protein